MTDANQEFTEEEVREKFLDHVRNLIEYWDVRGTNQRSRLHGLAFSIMTLLDGGAVGLPAFLVVPCPHETDKKYHQDNGERWFPENHESKVNCNIAGSLHEELFQF